LSGSFSYGGPATLAGSMVLADALEFVAAASNGNSFTSSEIALRSDMPSSIPIVFIPRTITLPAGTYAGTTISISLAAATTPCAVVSNQCNNGFYGTAFSSGVKRWASYPIPVLIDAGMDTISIWDALHAMESSAGRQMFVVDDGTAANRIQVKSGLPNGITGFSGYTTWNWDVQSRMSSAVVWLTTTSSRSLTQHEFLHALGFWHTCAWTSVMGGYGCPQAPEVSSTEIAYLLLASGVYDAERSLRLPNGQLPCGTMSLFAALPNQTTIVHCSGNSLLAPESQVRQESAP